MPNTYGNVMRFLRNRIFMSAFSLVLLLSGALMNEVAYAQGDDLEDPDNTSQRIISISEKLPTEEEVIQELLVTIFEYLDRFDISSVSVVCRVWQETIDCDYLWKIRFQTLFPEAVVPRSVKTEEIKECIKHYCTTYSIEIIPPLFDRFNSSEFNVRIRNDGRHSSRNMDITRSFAIMGIKKKIIDNSKFFIYTQAGEKDHLKPLKVVGIDAISNNGKSFGGRVGSPEPDSSEVNSFIYSEKYGGYLLGSYNGKKVQKISAINNDGTVFAGLVGDSSDRHANSSSFSEPIVVRFYNQQPIIHSLQDIFSAKKLLADDERLLEIKCLSPNGQMLLGKALKKGETMLWKATIPRSIFF